MMMCMQLTTIDLQLITTRVGNIWRDSGVIAGCWNVDSKLHCWFWKLNYTNHVWKMLNIVSLVEKHSFLTVSVMILLLCPNQPWPEVLFLEHTVWGSFITTGEPVMTEALSTRSTASSSPVRYWSCYSYLNVDLKMLTTTTYRYSIHVMVLMLAPMSLTIDFKKKKKNLKVTNLFLMALYNNGH